LKSEKRENKRGEWEPHVPHELAVSTTTIEPILLPPRTRLTFHQRLREVLAPSSDERPVRRGPHDGEGHLCDDGRRRARDDDAAARREIRRRTQ
jgi:hypothetical protein